MEFEKILKEERLKRNISQQRLADMSGVTKRAIAYWESGKRKMTVESADKVFRALGVSITIGAGSIDARKRMVGK